MKRTTLVLMVILTVFLVRMERTQGLMCYECPLCTPEKDAENKTIECPLKDGNDRCHSIEKKDRGITLRTCRTKDAEDRAKLGNLTCDKFASQGEKWCFCATDLCNNDFSYLSSTTAKNDGTIGTGTGYTSRQLFLGFTIASALFIWNLYF